MPEMFRYFKRIVWEQLSGVIDPSFRQHGKYLVYDAAMGKGKGVSLPGGGNVVGPASATDNAITRYDNTTGKLIQDSSAAIDDDGSVNIPLGQTYKINGSAHGHAHSHSGLVTNGDEHDHSGGDGAQIAYSGLGSIPSTFNPESHGNEAHGASFITSADVTYEALSGNSDVGTGSTQVAQGDHTHAGASPSETVEAETSFGVSSNAGEAVAYSRGDHTHGSPTNPVTGHESSYNHGLLHDNTNDPTADQKSGLAGTSGTPSGTNKYVTNDDSRNSDARTPTAHGQAESTITFTDITNGDVSTSAHGYCLKAPNNTTQFLRADATWATPPAAGASSFTPGSFTVSTNNYVILCGGMKFTTTQRITGQGTGRVRII
jgi:hypothetical protein